MNPKHIRLKPYSPVCMTWLDANSLGNASEASLALALKNVQIATRKTYAMFMGIGKKDGHSAVLLATDDDRTPDDSEAFAGLIWTPLSLVLKIEALRLPEPKRKKRRA